MKEGNTGNGSRQCDNCKEKFKRKNLGRIRGKYYCKRCQREIRENHREETLNNSGEKEKIIELEKNEGESMEEYITKR